MSHDEPQPVLPFHLDQVLGNELLASLMGVSLDTLQRQRARGTPHRAPASAIGATVRACVITSSGSTNIARGQKPDEPIQ